MDGCPRKARTQFGGRRFSSVRNRAGWGSSDTFDWARANASSRSLMRLSIHVVSTVIWGSARRLPLRIRKIQDCTGEKSRDIDRVRVRHVPTGVRFSHKLERGLVLTNGFRGGVTRLGHGLGGGKCMRKLLISIQERFDLICSSPSTDRTALATVRPLVASEIDRCLR